MKVLKVLAVILVVLVGLFVVLASVSPSNLEIEKTETINASAKAVMSHVECMDKWPAWSAWDKMDPEMKNTYSENPCGPGAWNSWDGPQTGKGKQTIDQVIGQESIKMSLVFEGFEGVNFANWKFEEVDGATKVTWNFVGAESPFMMRPMNLMMKGVLEESYQTGLSALKNVVESSPAEEEEYVVNSMVIPAGGLLLISSDVNPQNVESFCYESFNRIKTYMEKNNVEMQGRPSALFYSWTDTLAKMSAAIPVASKVNGSEDIEYREIEQKKGLKIDYYGPLKGSMEAHLAMDEYMQQNGLELDGAVIEVYETSPELEPDTSKWLTHVIYPIK